MIPPTPRLRTVPLPLVPGNPPSYSPVLPSPPRSSAIDLNPLLKPSTPPRLYYDLTLPPCTIIFDGSHSPLTLAMPATTPPVTCFRIIPPTTPAWPVMVFNPHGVTVFDVFSAIYRSLHTPVSPSAWDGLDLPSVVPSPTPTPLRSRSYDFPRTPPSTPSMRGERRVDHLQGETMFLGLKKGPGGPESWVLQTKAGDRSA